MKRLLIVSLAVLCSCQAIAQTVTWTGAVDTIWNKSANWSPVSFPGPCDLVKLPATTNSPSLSSDVYIKALEFSGGYVNTNTNGLNFSQGVNGLSPIVYADLMALNPATGTTTIDNVTYNNHSARKSYSIGRSANTCPRIYRFEVRPGDHWAGDLPTPDNPGGNTQNGGYKERAELSHPNSVDIRIPFVNDTASASVAYSIFIENGGDVIYTDTLKHHHCYLGQWKNAGSGGPPWAIKLIRQDSLQFETRSFRQSIGGTATRITRHTAIVSRGAWHNFVIKVKHSKTSPNPTGKVEWWIDGSMAFTITNINIGYNEDNIGYFKFGIYRTLENLGTTQVVRYANIEVKPGWNSLDARIADPLPLD